MWFIVSQDSAQYNLTALKVLVKPFYFKGELLCLVEFIFEPRVGQQIGVNI